MTTDIKITATTPQGGTTSKTITYINPDATNAQLATLGTMINSLTDNQYVKTTKITQVDVDTEADGDNA